LGGRGWGGKNKSKVTCLKGRDEKRKDGSKEKGHLAPRRWAEEGEEELVTVGEKNFMPWVTRAKKPEEGGAEEGCGKGKEFKCRSRETVIGGGESGRKHSVGCQRGEGDLRHFIKEEQKMG